jgi:hypothetical protein
MCPIEEFSSPKDVRAKKVIRLSPYAGLRAGVLIWKESRFRYRFTLQAAPMK